MSTLRIGPSILLLVGLACANKPGASGDAQPTGDGAREVSDAAAPPPPGTWCGVAEGAGNEASLNNTFYVSPTGSDTTGDGSEQNPWAGPEFATDRMQAGDTLILEDGLYTLVGNWRIGTPGTENAPITIRARNPRGAHVTRAITGPEAAIVVGAWDSATNDWTPNVPFWLNFDGLEVSGGRKHCLQLAGASHVTIKNSDFHDSGNDPIKNNAGARFNLIVNNDIHDSNASGLGNSDGIDVTSSDCIVVRNNTIHDIRGGKGLYFKKGSHNCLAELNLFYNIAFEGLLSGESSPDYEATMRNNILYSVGYSGLAAYGSHGSKFTNNTCYLTGADQLASPGVAAAFRASTSQNRNDADPNFNDAKFNENLTIHNNIFVVENANGWMLSFGDPAFCPIADCNAVATSNAEQIAELHSDYNLYFSVNASPMTYRWKGARQSGLAGWRSFSADLGNEQDVRSVEGSPDFLSTDPSDPQFLRLAPNSIARGAADDGDDLGAYETGNEIIGKTW